MKTLFSSFLVISAIIYCIDAEDEVEMKELMKGAVPWDFKQAGGHIGDFKPGPTRETIFKKLSPREEENLIALMKDVLRPYVPEYKGRVKGEGKDEWYLEMENVESRFDNKPFVMICKIGVRTYLEEELSYEEASKLKDELLEEGTLLSSEEKLLLEEAISKAEGKPKLKPRKDMYEKMIKIDKDAPTEEEHRAKAVTKPRYQMWRDKISSTAKLGFRIVSIKKDDKTDDKFEKTKSSDQILSTFKGFIGGHTHAMAKYIQRLKEIRATLLRSPFFLPTRGLGKEVIGSSLLFVHDGNQASIWLIDFAKTVPLPGNKTITHDKKWILGNHEDGYLIGINNLINTFESLGASSKGSIHAVTA